jgi:hypothetical protein
VAGFQRLTFSFHVFVGLSRMDCVLVSFQRTAVGKLAITDFTLEFLARMG